MECTVTVSDKLCLHTEQLSFQVLSALRQRLTIANPERRSAVRAGADPDSVKPLIRLYKEHSGQMLIPRGAVNLLQKLAMQHCLKLTWRSEVVSRSVRKLPLHQLPVELRAYQREAVQALHLGVQGYIKAPCGAGKTIIGASAIASLGEPALVLVHTHDLLGQWSSLFSEWGFRVRLISGGQAALAAKPLRINAGHPEIAVATVQTLIRAGSAADSLLRSAGAVLLDEAHHAPAGSFRELLERCPARYRWGVTATPNRDDGWDVLLPMVIGPERWSISMSSLVRMGWLMMPELLAIRSGAALEPHQYLRGNKPNMTAATNVLVQHPARQKLLLQLAQLLSSRQRTTLLLVPRRKQAHSLASELQKMGVLAQPVTSSVSKNLREQRLHQLREGQLSVLVATQLADEGLDVPRLDALIIASTGRAAGRAVQRIGRVMRLAPGKSKPLVIDIVDPTPFGGQWRARSRAYLNELGLVASPPVMPSDALGAVERML